MSFPMVVETALEVFGRPCEFIVAMGLGRSYGQESKFFGKKFLGILQSDLWAALDRAPAIATVALVADVGNDLAYEAPVARVVEWVARAIDALVERGARAALNNVPLASLQTVGAARYRIMRSVLFPKCRVPRVEMLRRAEELSRALENVAKTRKVPVFSGESAWYGFDPIHPRRASRGEIWQRMFAALAPAGAAVAMRPPAPGAAVRLRRAQARAWSTFGANRRARGVVERLDDGSTVALF
jgi:hypothetical protein